MTLNYPICICCHSNHCSFEKKVKLKENLNRIIQTSEFSSSFIQKRKIINTTYIFL